jgi:hypothetical protein
MLLAGMGSIIAGLAILGSVVAYWSASRYSPIANVLPAVAGTSLIVMGMQNALGGFLLAILNGHEADFLHHLDESRPTKGAGATNPQEQQSHAA